jgi:hypothetical protein
MAQVHVIRHRHGKCHPESLVPSAVAAGSATHVEQGPAACLEALSVGPDGCCGSRAPGECELPRDGQVHASDPGEGTAACSPTVHCMSHATCDMLGCTALCLHVYSLFW